MEGFGNKIDCPQFGKLLVISIQETDNTELAPPGVAIPLATTLSVAQSEYFLKAKEARVIAIVGPQDAGKTSLIAGLYDLFQRGQVGHIAFGFSYSLHAFEEAAHNSRAASRRESPETTRTPRGEVRFYHLDLIDTQSGTTPTVLLGDRAGEEYLETRSNLDSAKNFPELPRADVLTILVDGQRLLNAGHRHNVRSEIRQTLQAFVEAKAFRDSQRLAIVLTKVDMVLKSEDGGKRAMEDFDGLVTSLRTAHASKFAVIEPFKIAAQPKSDGARPGDGLDKLLIYWMSVPLRYRPAPLKVQTPSADRYFTRLQSPKATEAME